MPREVRLFNTLTRAVEPLRTETEGVVTFYACGPTVYNYAHIGNLRTYVSEDFIKRALTAAGYEVRHVMNITDVGHLQYDEVEAGEDKMSLAAARERKDPWQIARFYEEAFLADTGRLGIVPADVVPRATEHVEEMIAFVRELEDRGFTYTVDGNVYFSVERFPEYGTLARLGTDGDDDDVARVEADPRKRDPRDFVLWFSQSKFPNQIMQWDSPWGRGFPGWHIECSAMGSKYLGERIDLHMGGIDHIPVHHTNERAQSNCRFDHEWVTQWAHCGFLIIDDDKMAKSADNFLRLATLEERGFEPLHYRYFAAQALYRSEQKFSWESLAAAREAFETLKNTVVGWKLRVKAPTPAGALGPEAVAHRDAFWAAAWDDFNMPRALAALWTMARDGALPEADRLALALDFDRLLGFGVEDMRRPALPDDLMAIVTEREAARADKDWSRADALRDELLEHGIQLKDSADGTDWYRVFSEV
jgi:cysteinyl-tRNA synthetase